MELLFVQLWRLYVSNNLESPLTFATGQWYSQLLQMMMAVGWLQAHPNENWKQTAATKKQLCFMDFSKNPDLFETNAK